jgi:hypothetical protein
VHFGLTYGDGEKRDLEKEKTVDFMDLAQVIEELLHRG